MLVPFTIGTTAERLKVAGEKAGMDGAVLDTFASTTALIMDLSTDETGAIVGGHVVDTKKKEEPQPTWVKVTPELIISKYIETRDLIEAKKKALDAELAKLKEVQEKRESYLMGRMDKAGLTSMKAAGVGTVFIDYKDSATIADGQTFKAWVQEDYDERNTFMDVRVSKTAVKQCLEDGQPLPPGINYVKIKGVKVRRG